jgi:hypothetical protein
MVVRDGRSVLVGELDLEKALGLEMPSAVGPAPAHPAYFKSERHQAGTSRSQQLQDRKRRELANCTK